MRVVAGPICAVVAALMAAGCGRNRYDPWLVPEEQFAATVRTIALVSTEMPEDLEDPDPAQATFDSLLAAELRAAGFIVVTPAVTREIWGRLVDSVGGYYDPFTGRKDTTKYHPVRRAWRRILRETHGADVALFPGIIVVDARVVDWKATWDGTSQTVEPWGKVVLRVLGAVANGLAGTEPPDPGERTTPAFSLEVQIEHLDGEVMYVNRGGIEVWARPGGQRVPRSALFQDMERNVKAVRAALGSSRPVSALRIARPD